MVRRVLFAAVVGALTLGGLVSAGQDGKVQQQLKRLLERFPQADTNGDGQLTVAEAKAFGDKARAARDAKAKRQAAGRIEPTFANVRYGEHDRNVLDLYLAESSKPTALIVYIHGGGFVGGLIAVVCIVGIVSYLMIRGGRKTVAKPAKLSI